MRNCYALLLMMLCLCGTAYGQAQPRLVVNEILADPAADAPGDANGDGTRSSSGDEFVELYNNTNADLDLTGWQVGDDEGIGFTFPAGYTLPSRAIVVLFGDGDVSGVTGYNADPLLTRVFSADSTIGNGLANGGEYLVILSPDGNEDMYVAYGSKNGQGAPATDAVAGVTFEFGIDIGVSAGSDVSVVRSPDGNTTDADPWVLHTDVSAALFSPGTTVNGLTSVPKPLPPLTLIINEFLADPSTDLALGDANGDGERSSSGDEFVELANAGDAPLDLSGWTLGDDENFVTFTFPQGYTLAPREIVVIFGGGNVENVAGYDADPLQSHAFVVDSVALGIGNGLANGGDFIYLLSADGSYDTYLGYGSKAGTAPDPAAMPDGVSFELELSVTAPANADNSVTRFPDGNTNVPDPFEQHLFVSSLPFSPGTTIDGKALLPVPKPPVTVVINEVLADVAGDANGDGTVDSVQDQFIELVNASEETAVDLSGYQVGDAGGLTFTFPQGYTLAPQAFVAVFGGGDVSHVPGYSTDASATRVFAAGGSLGDGLDAAGDYAVLVSPDGAYDAYVAFGTSSGAGDPSVTGAAGTEWEFDLHTAAAADQDASITRDPDGDLLMTDPFVVHTSLGDLAYSPAQTSDGLNSLDDFVYVAHPWATGGALDFNWWERDRVEVPQASSLMPLSMPQGTVELWFKPDSVITYNTHDPDWTYLFAKNIGGNQAGDIGIGWPRGEGRLVFFMQDGTNTTNLYSSDDVTEVYYPRWYHLAVTWNTADSMRMFIDGKQVAAVESDIPLLGGEQALAIGGGAADLWNSRYESFRGVIDEVRFSLVERYQSDFEKPTAPYEPDQFTLALWHMDEGSGDTVADATGNGFDGVRGGVDGDGNADPASAPQWVDIATLVDVEDQGMELPGTFVLEQNYPNPFNPSTTIAYTVPHTAKVEVSIYNVLGQRVRTLVSQTQTAGQYRVTFDAGALASGLYFYTLRTADAQLVQKMLLVK